VNFGGVVGGLDHRAVGAVAVALEGAVGVSDVRDATHEVVAELGRASAGPEDGSEASRDVGCGGSPASVDVTKLRLARVRAVEPIDDRAAVLSVVVLRQSGDQTC